jgi:uncharacterized lipoprotein
MKKWTVLILFLLILSGCSWKNFMKWFDKMEWERDDQTVRIVDLFLN